jgi:hypothetical protein
MANSRIKIKLQNSIMASKITFDNPSEEIRCQIMQKLSAVDNPPDISIYHIESLYRDNANDKYALSNGGKK